MLLSLLLFVVFVAQPLFAQHTAKDGGQERYLEWEYDACWYEPEECNFRENELGADWPGKRTDPFYDALTR